MAKVNRLAYSPANAVTARIPITTYSSSTDNTLARHADSHT